MYVHENYRVGYNPEFVRRAIAKKAAKKPVEYDTGAAEADLAALAEQRAFPFWVRDIVRDVAAEYGVLPSELVGKSVTAKPFCARRKAMYEILKCTPILTASQIGKWFDRDWWSVSNAIAGYAVDNGKPKLVGFNIEARRARRMEYYRERAKA